jgi:hypothetical protein
VITTPCSFDHDRRRLQNVFNKLAVPNHPLRAADFQLRDEISTTWCRQAEANRWFAWPSTSAPDGIHKLRALKWRPQGMLSVLGYHVGETITVNAKVRECILEYVFEQHLPPVGDAIYFHEWGKPETARRLQKLANTLASLARNAKRRRTASFERAIHEWAQDLEFLYEKYYARLFGFGWPATEPQVPTGVLDHWGRKSPSFRQSCPSADQPYSAGK